MILSDSDVDDRLASPFNLANRLRIIPQATREQHESELAVFGVSRTSPTAKEDLIVSLPPSIDNLVNNVDHKVKLANLQEAAASILHETLGELKRRLPEVSAAKLSVVAADMNRIVNSVNDRQAVVQTNNIQIVIYSPVVSEEREYSIIEVTE